MNICRTLCELNVQSLLPWSEFDLISVGLQITSYLTNKKIFMVNIRLYLLLYVSLLYECYI